MLVSKHETLCILHHPRFLLKKRGIMGLVISKKCEYEIEKKIENADRDRLFFYESN